MGMRPRDDRKGLASLFDAFMFLMAMAALCALLSIDPTEMEGAEPREWRGLVERVHAVLVASSLQLRDEGTEPAPDSPWVRITSLAVPTDGKGERMLAVWAREEVEGMVHEMLGSGWRFEWSFQDKDIRSILAGEEAPGDADRFVSSIGISGAGKEGTIFILSTWRS